MFARLLFLGLSLAASPAFASEFLADFENVEDFANYGPGAWAQQLIQSDPQFAHSGDAYIENWTGEEHTGLSVDYSHPDLPWVFKSGWFRVALAPRLLVFGGVDVGETINIEIQPGEWRFIELNVGTIGFLGVNVSFGEDAFLAADDLLFMLPGDTDSDFDIDLNDLNNVRNNFGYVGSVGDGNSDGVVDIKDLNDVRNGFSDSSSAAVPEPEAVIMLVGACIALFIADRLCRLHRSQAK